jgi:hypothetical protein
VGAGAAGGLIAGAIIGALINADVGKIVFAPTIDSEEFRQKMGNVAATRTLLQKVGTGGLSTGEPLPGPEAPSVEKP